MSCVPLVEASFTQALIVILASGFGMLLTPVEMYPVAPSNVTPAASS